ncbi:hypothetical protein [Streptomyces daghestanicus]|nr:hypothetical protein [Streptomyces daghestanicus]GGU55178.1 hypothetical protein GCM10010259_53020 [Streptomyces daghestanicus]GHI32337.1 hypothetical protein Sdagh_40670 [Streptomyces daghestanicus]
MTNDPYGLDVRVVAPADATGRDEKSGDRAGRGPAPAVRQASWPMTSTTLHPMAAEQPAVRQATWPMTSGTMHPMA